MKLSFTTLGCPQWDLRSIVVCARKYGFDGIDFRGLQDELDVTKTPQFTSRRAETRKMILDAGLEVSGLSTSIRICDASARREILEEARRSIAVALDLACPNIRVFGGGDTKAHSKEELARVGRETLREILSLDGAQFLNWLVETHDNWTSANDVLYLLDGLDHPSIGVLWDLAHPYRFSGEKPAETYALLGKRVKYTHVKDAVKDPGHPHAMADGWRYVNPGEGQVPLTEAVEELRKGGYQGYLTLEHEKRWHKDLPEPEEVFPKFVEWGKKVIGRK